MYTIEFFSLAYIVICWEVCWDSDVSGYGFLFNFLFHSAYKIAHGLVVHMQMRKQLGL
jgi:hypothetical protein